MRRLRCGLTSGGLKPGAYITHAVTIRTAVLSLEVPKAPAASTARILCRRLGTYRDHLFLFLPGSPVRDEYRYPGTSDRRDHKSKWGNLRLTKFCTTAKALPVSVNKRDRGCGSTIRSSPVPQLSAAARTDYGTLFMVAHLRKRRGSWGCGSMVSAKRTPCCKDSRRIAMLRHDQALETEACAALPTRSVKRRKKRPRKDRNNA